MANSIYTGDSFPTSKYNIILADPPWSYRDKASSGKRGASHKYPCMDLSDLMQLPVKSIAADDCVLFMWHVPVMPVEALKLVEAWGFQFKTMKAFTWVKLYQRFLQTVKAQLKVNELDDLSDEQLLSILTLISKMGMGNHTRGNTEDCLLAVRGRYARMDASIKQVVYAPFSKHSEKPEIVRQHIVSLVGDLPRIELFARSPSEGWDSWGNELNQP